MKESIRQNSMKQGTNGQEQKGMIFLLCKDQIHSIPSLLLLFKPRARGSYLALLTSNLIEAARTQAPTSTNNDVGSPTWGDLRQVHLQSAMEATYLGHGPSWSPIDPIQVSMLLSSPVHILYKRCSSLLVSVLSVWYSSCQWSHKYFNYFIINYYFIGKDTNTWILHL